MRNKLVQAVAAAGARVARAQLRLDLALRDLETARAAALSAPAPSKEKLFSLKMTGCAGQQFISVIKAVRGLTSIGLREAKDMVDLVRAGGSVVVIRDVPMHVAESARNELEAAGAIISVV